MTCLPVPDDLRFGAEREKRLNRLRGQRRISRSLLSYSDTNSNLLEDSRREDGGNATIRRHSHKKRTKNKFILKIARTLMNGTEEHLEVDIHCKHRQLFPNNTFVRDLVTILNERNVKVINNGRVFERNKVTELEQQAQKVLNKLDIEPPPSPAPPQPPAPRHQPGPRIRGPEVGMAQMREGVKQRIKKTKQSPAVQSVITQEPVSDALAQIEGLSALGGPPRIDIPPRHTPHKAKKIIIEDFVEVKRLTPSPAPLQGEKGGQPQRTRKRKRKRNHSTTAYPPPAPPPPAPAPPSPPPAVVPLVAPHDNTLNAVVVTGESRFRRNNSRVRPLRRNDIDSQSVERAAPREPRPAPRAPAPHDPRPRDPDTEYMRRSDTTDEPQYQSAAPVKVVMRSNLTFNLGDEFFAWRTRATDDLVSEFLGELAIPPTNATSGEASTARADPTSGQHSDSSSDSSGD
ncbi:hypothetical protein SFRURICE_016056 [Spodoptera frugiperda]|nr:hypothetical protein SFRURICE_016056 [Spodoptera frugiperda]